VFANLETPIGTEGTPVKDNKPYVFMVSPHYAEPIKKLHLNVVSIANNHIMDYGQEGLTSTIKWLKSNKVQYVGAGDNLEDARKPAIIKRKGIEFIFLAYNERPPELFFAKKETPGTAYLDIRLITEDIKKYKTKSNIVMVSLHWGLEQTLYPQPYQTELARSIIDAGADCIIGHHPHWIQGIEVYKKKPIFYSFGNLLNGFYNRIEYDNFIAVLRYRGLKLRRIEILPISGKNSVMDFQPYLLTGEEADEYLKLVKKLSDRFRTHFVIKNNKGYIYIVDETNNFETRGRGKNP
jgi:poly-gamma-glutamate synthesis protein (capsule biosynthesis protein)